MRRNIPFAIVYDFDGTLAPGNMQERDFIPQIGMTKKAFWNEVTRDSEKHEADNILMYMRLMLHKAEAASLPVRRQDFEQYGKKLDFFDGVLPYKKDRSKEKGWFDRIDEYGKLSGVKVEHYIVSSGIREMVLASQIGRKFRAVFASSFYYDPNGVAKWPALALNYTSKTQYLFRINKGCLDVHDNEKINKYLPDQMRAIPFSHMVYIGDGETDIPCFRLVKDRGGYSIAVYKSRTKNAKNKSLRLVKDERVHFIAPANYKTGEDIDRIVKAIIDKVAGDYQVDKLKPQDLSD